MMHDPFGLAGLVIDGQFRVERIIGEGGFSVVYRGLHQGLGEPIAVKCLKLTAQLDTEAIENFTRRFRDEGRLQYRLGQGNLDIVRCITSGTVTATTGALVPYLVLEWLEGASLALDLRIRRDRGMTGRPLEEVIAMFEPCAKALDYAHTLGVVHRDVKPGNLFLAQRAGGVRMKVLDFGLAKVLDETIGITLAATMGNMMMCSPRYAAPEQFDPSIGAVGPWTDVYSLGLVVLEALRDQRVRKGDGMIACMQEATDARNAITATALGIKVPSRIELALARATALDVRTRQQSAGQLWDELSAAMRRRATADLGAAARAGTQLGVGMGGVPPNSSPASFDKTTVDPNPPGGLGSTVMMSDAPPRTQPSPTSPTPFVPAATVAFAPAPPTPRPPDRPIPNLAPALHQPARPPPLPPMGPIPGMGPPQGATPGYGQPIYQPSPSSYGFAPPSSHGQPMPPARASRAPLVVFVLLLVLGALGAAGFFGWRMWKARGGELHLGACEPRGVGAQSASCDPDLA
jgi:serine/threonine-protein kinase